MWLVVHIIFTNHIYSNHSTFGNKLELETMRKVINPLYFGVLMILVTLKVAPGGGRRKPAVSQVTRWAQSVLLILALNKDFLERFLCTVLLPIIPLLGMLPWFHVWKGCFCFPVFLCIVFMSIIHTSAKCSVCIYWSHIGTGLYRFFFSHLLLYPLSCSS